MNTHVLMLWINNLQELYIMGHNPLIVCVCIACSSGNIMVFGSCQGFDERISLQFVLHNALHVGLGKEAKSEFYIQ